MSFDGKFYAYKDSESRAQSQIYLSSAKLHPIKDAVRYSIFRKKY
jgi:hypothetical protein